MLKRLGILGLAAVLLVALGTGSAHAAKPKKVESAVDVDGYTFPPPDFNFAFLGNVYAKKAKCVRNRTVTLSVTQDGETSSEVLGTTTTDRTGDWVLEVQSSPVGDYVAEVAKKKLGRKGKKLVCKQATSPTFIWLS